MFHSSELSTIIISSTYLAININTCLFSIFPSFSSFFLYLFFIFLYLPIQKYLAHDLFIELGIFIVVFNYIGTMKLSNVSGLIHENLLPLYILSQSFNSFFCGWVCAIEFTHKSTFTTMSSVTVKSD